PPGGVVPVSLEQAAQVQFPDDDHADEDGHRRDRQFLAHVAEPLSCWTAPARRARGEGGTELLLDSSICLFVSAGRRFFQKITERSVPGNCSQMKGARQEATALPEQSSVAGGIVPRAGPRARGALREQRNR